MSRYIKLLVAGLLLIGFSSASWGQTQDKTKLAKQKEKLKKDIQYSNKLLKETKKGIKVGSTELVILNTKISKREQLISTIKAEVRYLDQQISTQKELISSMESDLELLRSEYADLIRYAYKNRSSYDRLMFIFAADDFNQAYKRFKYLQQYSEYRKQQAVLIQKTQEEINRKVQELEQKKAEKEGLLNSEKEEKTNLIAEKQEQQSVLTNLKNQQNDLRAEIRKKEKEAEKLKAAIDRIIAMEIKEEERRRKEQGFNASTPEAKALSSSFTNNKGKLPWPTENGVITERFGEHQHPVLNHVIVNNNGLDIGTTKGATARAVFSGTVSGVVVIPGMGKAIMIRHGEYLTVYAKLAEAFVNPGDKVKTKDVIGTVLTDESANKTIIHFEIWKDKTILNPHTWLYRANA